VRSRRKHDLRRQYDLPSAREAAAPTLRALADIYWAPRPHHQLSARQRLPRFLSTATIFHREVGAVGRHVYEHIINGKQTKRYYEQLKIRERRKEKRKAIKPKRLLEAVLEVVLEVESSNGSSTSTLPSVSLPVEIAS
jgi:hypothetical protein